MPRVIPTTGEIYHVYNRGVEKRRTFLNDADHLRFIHDLFEFNDASPALNLWHHLRESYEVGLPTIERRPKKPLVELLAFCLMPNHFHLLLRQVIDSGITAFMQKLGTGYTKYFNQKHERVGHLFQGKYKHVHVVRDSHLFYLAHYIHCNPLDLVAPEWRSGKIKNLAKAKQFLEAYRWSSYGDYIDKKNFPAVTQREPLLELFGKASYQSNVHRWLSDMHLDEIGQFMLE